MSKTSNVGKNARYKVYGYGTRVGFWFGFWLGGLVFTTILLISYCTIILVAFI